MSGDKNIGTVLERRRRRQFWAVMTLLGLLTVVMILIARTSAGPDGTIAPAVALILCTGLIVLLVGGYWLYYRSVDELVWANNLVASFWGFNAFILAVPVWHFLWKARLAPEPHLSTIYLGAAGVTTIVYLWRKFR